MAKECNACKRRVALNVRYCKDLECDLNVCPACGHVINKKVLAIKKAPTKIEVCNFFVDNGYTKEGAIQAWNFYNDAHWHNSQGKPVLNWKQTMRANQFWDSRKIGAAKQNGSYSLEKGGEICDRCGGVLPNDAYVEDKSTYCSIKCMKGEQDEDIAYRY